MLSQGIRRSWQARSMVAHQSLVFQRPYRCSPFRRVRFVCSACIGRRSPCAPLLHIEISNRLRLQTLSGFADADTKEQVSAPPARRRKRDMP